MLQSIKKRTSNKKLFCGSPINRSFGALSILRDKKERVKAMDIAARLAIIPYQIQDIENNKLHLEESLGGIWWPMFIFSVNPSNYIPNHIVSLQNKIRILENRKKALLEEQQSLIVAAAHYGEKNRKR